MQQSADKGQTLMVQTFIYSAVMYGAEGTRRRRSRRHQSAVKKAPAFPALHPRDCSSDVLYGDTGLLPPGVSLMLPNCVGSTDARTWRLADGPRRRCDSHSRVAVVSAGLRWARTVR
jgi:hypothetical protein